jgi:hypothetical protein
MTIGERAKGLIDKQNAKGFKKYGFLLDDNPAKFIARIRHAQEEVAGLLQYLIWMEDEAKKLETIIALHHDTPGAFDDEDLYTNTDPITII